MVQVKKAGIKQFFTVLFLTVLILFLFEIIRQFMSSYAVIADILSLICILILGYNVLIHYSAIFTYTCDDKRIKINRMIGKKNKEIEFKTSSIISVSSKKPDTKYIYNFNPKILPGKNSKYITYNKKRIVEAVLIEADEEMNSYLKNFKYKD